MHVKSIGIDTLRPYDKNPRVNAEAIDVVLRSIDKHGFNQPIVTDENMRICVGHTRWLAAKKLCLKEVPVYVKKMTEAQFIAYNMADNKSSDYSEFDNELLSGLMKELRELDENMLDSTAFSSDEIKGLLDASDIEDLIEEIDVTAHTRTTSDKVHVKMVQLFYNELTFPKFIEMCEAIQEKAEKDNLTDTVFHAVEECYKK